jgi:metallopeptidase MepB
LLFGPVEIASAYQQWAILTLGVQIANEQAPAALPPSQAPINGNTTEPIAALRSPPQPPINWNATPNSILDGAINKVEESKLVVEGILKSITSSTASFYNVVLPIAHDENEATTLRSVMIFLQTVSPQQELRNACSNAEQLTNVYYGEAAANEALFKLVDAAIKKKEMLDPESQQLLENEYQSYIDSGLGIPPGPQRTRFKEITERLAELKVLFLRNLYEEDGGLWLTLENLTNVPDDFRSRLIPGEGTNEVKLYLTFKPPDLVPALEYIDDCEVRKTIFIANENKCRDNEPFFREAVILRDEAARLLAYPDWASYKTSDKIAQNTTFVVNFLEGLQQRLVPKGMMELKYLEALKDMDSKQKKTACTDDKFSLWDYKYFHRQLLQQEFDIDWQKIAEWFQLESTLQGILSTYEKLFALEFVKLEAEQFDDNFELAWHESVKAYSVWDDASEGSGFIGYLYLDLFPRVGKQGGALNANIRPVSI